VGGVPVVAGFFEEVARYKQALTQSYAKILGKERAERVAKLDKSLLSPDSYLFKSAQLEEFITGGFSGEENPLFYVGMDLGKNHEFEIGPTGRIEAHSRMLKTFPLFFLSPKMVYFRQACAGQKKSGTGHSAGGRPGFDKYHADQQNNRKVKGVTPIDFFLTFFFITGIRAFFRLYYAGPNRKRGKGYPGGRGWFCRRTTH